MPDLTDLADATLALVEQKVAMDLQRGVTLWLFDCNDRHGVTHTAITAHPARLLMELVARDGRDGLLDLMDGEPVGARLTALVFTNMPDAQIAALVTLPRECFHTREALVAHGLEVRTV